MIISKQKLIYQYMEYFLFDFLYIKKIQILKHYEHLRIKNKS